jgi:hypothetical protein
MKKGDRVRIITSQIGRRRSKIEVGTVTGVSRGGLVGVDIDPDTAADDSPWYPLSQTVYSFQLEVIE